MTEEERKAEAARIIRDAGRDVDFVSVAEMLATWDGARERWNHPSEDDLNAVWDLIGNAKVSVTW